jgi:YD repeat-containing protein
MARNGTIRTAGLTIALMLAATGAQAQQRTYYGPDGRVTGREVIGSGGSTTIYDNSGRVAGRTATDSQGTTTIYSADGRRIGTEQQDRR